jgi:hypothetical protein
MTTATAATMGRTDVAPLEAESIPLRRSSRESKTAVTVYHEAAARKKSDDDEKKRGRMVSPKATPTDVVLAKEPAVMTMTATTERTDVVLAEEAVVVARGRGRVTASTTEEALVAVSEDRSFRVSIVLASDKVIGVSFNQGKSKGSGKWVSIIYLYICLLIYIIYTLIHLVCLTMFFFLQHVLVYRSNAQLHCGCFTLKSEAIAAKAVAEDTIDEYIRSTFNVEKSATLTTEQGATLLNWWKDERKRDKSLINRDDGLPPGIYLKNNKYVSCLCL